LEVLSRVFLGVPYQLFSLGEGRKGRFDQCPLYRFDQFDCETYVTTVLALAFSQNLTGYKRCLQHIRYQGAEVSFEKRNHFTSIDWNQQAQRLGLLRDVTQTIHDEKGQSLAVISKTEIDKPSWYALLTQARIRLHAVNQPLQNVRLKELRGAGRSLPKVTSELAYIPFRALFNASGKPNLYVFNQIPSGAIIEIVRPNWAIKDKIGTNLDISHLGFAFWSQGKLWFRNASSVYKKVVDEPLIPYLQAAKKVPSIGGINIQVAASELPMDCIW
jgi:hypothetical protein